MISLDSNWNGQEVKILINAQGRPLALHIQDGASSYWPRAQSIAWDEDRQTWRLQQINQDTWIVFSKKFDKPIDLVRGQAGEAICIFGLNGSQGSPNQQWSIKRYNVGAKDEYATFENKAASGNFLSTRGEGSEFRATKDEPQKFRILPAALY